MNSPTHAEAAGRRPRDRPGVAAASAAPTHGHAGEELSPALFAITVGLTVGGLVLGLKILAPAEVWHTQWSAPVWKALVVLLAMTGFNCFVEYFFHRYVLHKPVIPLLSHFYRQHTLHHSLTRIGRQRTPQGRMVPFIENIYPITRSEQTEASFFPWYTLAVFALGVTPLLALGHWLAPSFPWFVAGYAAMACSLVIYEGFHAIEHWPIERWAPLLEHARWGRLWRKIYSFHLRHHAVIDCNEGVSGFFTLPLADWLFGTCVFPKTLYADNSEWQEAQFERPRPRWLVRWLDRQTDAIVSRRRRRARA
ncbi:MAG TPA: hypothetical protein VGD81_04500 [Opitutaceae bacterium]